MIWFKNARVYPWLKLIDLSGLSEALEAHAFSEPGPLQERMAGFVPPAPGAGYVLEVNGCMLLCLQTETKQIPGECLRRNVAEKVEALEVERGGLKVAKRERDRIADDVRFDLMRNALSVRRRTLAYFDVLRRLLVVDAASDSVADMVTDMIHTAIGELPIALPLTNERPAAVMTRWLADGDPGEGWDVENECELRLPGEGGAIVRCRNQELWTKEIAAHLEHGKEVERLALCALERVHFVLDAKLNMRRLRFSDLVHDDAADSEADSPLARAASDFAILSMELRETFQHVWHSFGGLDDAGMGRDL